MISVLVDVGASELEHADNRAIRRVAESRRIVTPDGIRMVMASQPIVADSVAEVLIDRGWRLPRLELIAASSALGDDGPNHTALDVGQAEVPAGITVGEPFMIEAK